MTDQEAHDALSKMARDHVPLGGVNPPDEATAAAGTMKDAPDETPEKTMTFDGTDAAGGFDALAPDPSSAAESPAKPPPPLAPPKPAVDLSGPLGYRAPRPARDTELEQLQADAKDRRATAHLGQAVTDFNERPTNFLDYAQRLGGGGASAPPKKSTLWDTYEAEGEQPLKDLQARRDSAAKLAAADALAAGKAEGKDPNGERAKIYRSVLLRFSPELTGQLDSATPEQMERIAPWLESYAKDNAEALKTKAAAEAKAKEDADRKAQHDADKVESGRRADQFHNDAQDNAAATRALAGAQFNFGKQKFAADEVDKEEHAKEAADAKDQAGAQHLGDKAAEGQSAAKALDDIDAVIAKNPDDIPGIGRAKSALIPDALKPVILSQEGQNLRSNAKDVLGVLLHKRSGAAVSTAELARYEQIYGLNGDEAQFTDGMKRLRRDFAEELRGAEAGVSPGARAKFKAGGGKLADDVLHDTGDVRTLKDGTKLRVFKDGTSEVVE